MESEFWPAQAAEGVAKLLRLALRSIWWLLRAAIGPVLPLAIVAGLLALVATVTVLGMVESVVSDWWLQTRSKTAVSVAMPRSRSFDNAEEEHRLPWSLVATIVRQSEEEGKGAGALEVARELAPKFSYAELKLTSEHKVGQPDGTVAQSTRTVTVLAEADTFRGTYTYRYRVVRRPADDGYDETAERESVSYTENWGRLVAALQKFLGRPVEDWEARWIANLAADVGGSQEPGQWLLAEDPDSWWGGFDWKSTWTGTPGAGKVLPLPEPWVITSPFGQRIHPVYGTEHFHMGVDLAADIGVPVRAAQAGKVQHAGPAGGYGLAVIVDHGGGWHTVYAHLSRISVRVGQEVSAGHVVGEVGSTGVSTGPHLHFEVRQEGKPVDPLDWLRQ